jgi:hypothetical protein
MDSNKPFQQDQWALITIWPQSASDNTKLSSLCNKMETAIHFNITTIQDLKQTPRLSEHKVCFSGWDCMFKFQKCILTVTLLTLLLWNTMRRIPKYFSHSIGGGGNSYKLKPMYVINGRLCLWNSLLLPWEMENYAHEASKFPTAECGRWNDSHLLV